MVKLGFTKKDYAVITGVVIFGLLGGLVGHFLDLPVSIEDSTRFVTGLAILAGLYSLKNNIPGKKGSYARNLELLGLGTASFLISWLPHIGWHMSSNPTMLGLSVGFWTGLYHTWNAVSFLVIAYGLFLFYQSTRTERDEEFVSNGFLRLHLTARDYQFLMFTGWTILLGAVVGQVVGFSPVFEWVTTMVQTPFILASIYFISKNNVWEGQIGRSLNLVGIGLFMIMLNYIPHIPWHLMDNPAWGISTGFWVGLFHMWIAAGFILISYGFHEV